MITHNFVPSNVRITPELIKSVSHSHNRCTAFLKNQKKESRRSCRPTSPSTKKEIKDCEKKTDLTQLVESFNGDFVKYSLTAADENNPKKMK